MIVDYIINETTDIQASVMSLLTEQYLDFSLTPPRLSASPANVFIKPIATRFPNLYKLSIDNDPTIPNGHYMIIYSDSTNNVINLSAVYIYNGTCEAVLPTQTVKFGIQT